MIQQREGKIEGCHPYGTDGHTSLAFMDGLRVDSTGTWKA